MTEERKHANPPLLYCPHCQRNTWPITMDGAPDSLITLVESQNREEKAHACCYRLFTSTKNWKPLFFVWLEAAH